MRMRMRIMADSLAAPLGASMCWHLEVARHKAKGSAVLPGLVLSFCHAETLPKPMSIGIPGCGTGR